MGWATLDVMSEFSLSAFDGVTIDGLEFCGKVYELFEAIRQGPDGTSRLRLRPSKVEKRLLEELMPIAAYIQYSYRAGRYISVRWLQGSQPFDAEVTQHGSYIDQGYFPRSSYLELTCVVHPKEHMQREHLEKKGGTFGLDGIHRLPSGELISEPVVYSNGNFIDSFAELVVRELTKKSAKSYPENTSLIVECILNTLYDPSEWRDLMDKVQSRMPKNGFREVFFHDSTHNYACLAYSPK
ncbi:hypothetical protein FNL37_1013 [Methylovorus glucosotrophus]|nr:hypothetical protein FNL37_1013 [Methylovorus glucosotrophus]